MENPISEIQKVVDQIVMDVELKSKIRAIIMDNGQLRERLEAAEDYIENSPCDPDINDDQLKAYLKWKELKEKA